MGGRSSTPIREGDFNLRPNRASAYNIAPEFIYNESLKCQPELCQDFASKCRLSADMFGGNYIVSYGDHFCHVDLTGTAQLTCSEKCIPPPPVGGPQYVYQERIVCQPSLCEDFDSKCRLTGGVGTYSMSSDDSSCSIELTGTAEITCNEECIPQSTLPLEDSDGPEYVYYESMECQASFCEDFSSKCQLSGAGAYQYTHGDSVCNVELTGSVELTCSDECLAPAPPEAVPPSDGPEHVYYESMYCHPSFCEGFFEDDSTCDLVSLEGYGNAYLHLSGGLCDVQLDGNVELACHVPCLSL